MKKKAIGLCILVLFYLAPDILYPIEYLGNGSPIYIFSFTLGIYLALHRNFIDTLLKKRNRKAVTAFAVISLTTLCYLRSSNLISIFSNDQVDPFIVLFLSLLTICLREIKFQAVFPLKILGQHSMNMYLTHTFILGYFFSNFIYGFKYPILIFGVLLGCSLLFSICLEFIKNKVGFYKLQNNIVDWISNLHLTK